MSANEEKLAEEMIRSSIKDSEGEEGRQEMEDTEGSEDSDGSEGWEEMEGSEAWEVMEGRRGIENFQGIENIETQCSRKSRAAMAARAVVIRAARALLRPR